MGSYIISIAIRHTLTTIVTMQKQSYEELVFQKGGLSKEVFFHTSGPSKELVFLKGGLSKEVVFHKSGIS